MQIGELAKSLGVTTKTLRHYERIGLIPAACRTASGYRVFDEDAVRRARLVVGLRGLGLSVDKTRSLIASDAPGTLRRRLISEIDREVKQLAVEIAVLQGRYEDLSARSMALLATPEDDEDCVCAATLQTCNCRPKAKTSSRSNGIMPHNGTFLKVP
ncbi:MAG: MerR family DNA-binding transcriptional regulator [Pseudomonadota bacterium]